MAMRSAHAPLKVSLFGHFGSLNTGNESTLLAIVSHLRSFSPESEIRCVCSFPEAVTARYEVDAVPITATGSRDRDTPLVRRVAARLASLGVEYARAFGELRQADMLIVPGTGLVTNAYGLFGWGPYNLFKWVLMAKLGGARVLFISVGAGPVYGIAGRALVKATLSLADYRSYRDEASKDCLKGIGFPAERDPVYPDLAFGLPQTRLSRADGRCNGPRRVVGLGLMEHAGRYSATDPRQETYGNYLESLAVFAQWLLEHDYDIRLLLGDGDTHAIDEFKRTLRVRLGTSDEERVIARSIASVDDMLAELGAIDVVVATRFHNVLLALLLNRPVIAISFHHKCWSLMRQMKLSEYCHDIHRMDPDRLIRQFEELERNSEAVQHTIARGVEQARTAVNEQYDLLFPSIRDDPTGKVPRDRDLRRRLESTFLRHNERLWRRIPSVVRDLRPTRAYGAWLHGLVCQSANREMYLGTHFLRNRPALELMRRLVPEQGHGDSLKVAVLGCSIGVEVYSIMWTLRSRRPDLEVEVRALDISTEAVQLAERGVYGPEASEIVGHPVFDGLTEAERSEMFDWNGETATIKPWLREGITWQVGDACDPRLSMSLGPQDLVVANNFLCHMPARSARRCLRSLARLVLPGGHLFVTGVDLDVRTSVARELGWEPISELRAEIHDGDPLVRSDWPWRWWGLEPFDRRRADWETRYSAVFRVDADTQLALGTRR